jgi:hypothetical protein
MKTLIFNIYKVCYIRFSKEWFEKYPNSKRGFMGRLEASAGVMLFLFLLCMNIWLPFNIIFSEGWENPSKPLIWSSAFLAVFLIYILLFKILGLEDHNYSAPQHKPDERTIRQTWIIFAANGLLAIFLAVIKIIVRGH